MIRLTDNRPIGFTDSGVGGSIVVKEALKQLPNGNILFVGNTARCPYDPRPTEQVIQYTWETTDYLVEQGIKMLVVACNTVTAVALEEIKAALSIPVIDMVPSGIRVVVKETQNKQAGIIGMVGMVKGQAYGKALKEKVLELTVTSPACPRSASVTENSEHHSSMAGEVMAETLALLATKEINTLVLGRTHRPLLRPIIQSVMGENVQLIDSGVETVGEAPMLLDYFNLNNLPQNGRTLCQFYTTGSAKLFKEIAEDWSRIEYLNVEHIELGGK